MDPPGIEPRSSRDESRTPAQLRGWCKKRRTSAHKLPYFCPQGDDALWTVPSWVWSGGWVASFHFLENGQEDTFWKSTKIWDNLRKDVMRLWWYINIVNTIIFTVVNIPFMYHNIVIGTIIIKYYFYIIVLFKLLMWGKERHLTIIVRCACNQG